MRRIRGKLLVVSTTPHYFTIACVTAKNLPQYPALSPSKIANCYTAPPVIDRTPPLFLLFSMLHTEECSSKMEPTDLCCHVISKSVE